MAEAMTQRLDVDQKRDQPAGEGSTLQMGRNVCGDASISRYPAIQAAPIPIARNAADFQLSCWQHTAPAAALRRAMSQAPIGDSAARPIRQHSMAQNRQPTPAPISQGLSRADA